jgi:hypothetical protein
VKGGNQPKATGHFQQQQQGRQPAEGKPHLTFLLSVPFHTMVSSSMVGRVAQWLQRQGRMQKHKGVGETVNTCKRRVGVAV